MPDGLGGYKGIFPDGAHQKKRKGGITFLEEGNFGVFPKAYAGYSGVWRIPSRRKDHLNFQKEKAWGLFLFRER